MNNITISTNYRAAEKAEIAKAAALRMISCGATMLLPSYAKSVFEGIEGIKYVQPEKMYDNVDLVIVVGGDGSVLEAARRAAVNQTPILGINKGRLGYMTAIEANELELLDQVMSGNYYYDDRTMLNVELIHNGKMLYFSRALNDAVVSNGTIAKLVDMQLSANGKVVGNYRADGLIVSSPSGSTAYSLAAGGPIMAPDVAAFCVTPVCSHSFRDRPIVFPDSSVLEIKNVSEREPHLHLTIDGRIIIKMMKNQSVRISKSDKLARLVRIKGHSFYSDLCSKLASL